MGKANMKVKRFIFTLIILSLIFGFAYLLTQQTLRRGANDQQIKIAEEAAKTLAAGGESEFLRSNINNTIDLSKSPAPFLITFDNNDKPLAFTATLNGKIPVPPAGVFAYAKAHGEDRLTWQPAAGVRIAAVIVYYNGKREGYALAGRSLAEVEKRISSLGFTFFFAWIFSLIVAIIYSVFVWRKKK
jgi:hypothetical protein